MKTTLTILLISTSLVVSAQDAYWRFENNANDDMGNYNLTAVGGAGYSSSVKLEGSYSGNVNTNVGQRFVTSGDFNFGPDGLTINFAFYHSATTNYNTILDTRVNGTGNGMFIFLDCANRRIYLRTNDGTTTGDISTATNAYTLNAWNYISVRIYDTQAGYGKFFVNGAQSGTDTALQSGWDVTAQLALGGDLAGNSFWGYIDGVSINTCALTNAQIYALYTNRASEYSVACPTLPVSSYNPIRGRHVRFFANGIEKKDKPRPGGYFYWKLPDGITLPPAGNGDFYFSSINGNDANDGLTALTPKQTEAALKLLLPNLLPGDTVLFERGSSWNEVDLNITTSGTASEPIVFGDYGSGDLPIFKGSAVMTSFASAGGNLWYKSDSRIVNKLNRFYDAWTGSWQDYDIRTGGIGWVAINGTYSGMSQYPDGAPLSFEAVDEQYRYRWITDYSNPFPATNLANGYTQVKVMQGEWSPVFTTLTYSNASTLSLTEGDFLADFGYLRTGLKGKILNSTHSSVSNLNGEYTLIPSLQRIYLYYNSDINAQTVEIPVCDSVISITNASWVKLQNLDIRNSRLHNVKIHDGSNITIENCVISRCPGNGINIAGAEDITVIGNDISYADNGAGIAYGDGVIVTGNNIHHIGIDAMLGDKNGASSNGVYLRDNVGTNYVIGNVFDTLGYCGVHSHDDAADPASAGVIARNNLGREWCMKQTDGGFIYYVGNNEDAGSLVRGNIGIRSDSVTAWANETYTPIINGIYIDDVNSYVDVDSNALYGVGIFNHFGNSYNNYTQNKVLVQYYNNSINAAFHSEPSSSVSYYVNVSNNEFVSTNNSTSLFTVIGRQNVYTFSDHSTWTIDNNKYFSYNSGQNFFSFSTFWDNWQYFNTLAAWQTFTGKEASSTLKFNSTMSTTEAVMYMNYSSSSHEFDLGTATFRDYDNNVVSGSVTIPAYRSRILYKTGGSLDGDNPVYVVYP